MRDELVVLGTLTLPGVSRSVGQLRLFARDMLGRNHPRLDDITLCLVEKFGNAIQHTDSARGGWVSVILAAGDGLLRTEVIDDGAAGDRPSLAADGDPLAEHGRGLLLITALSDRWGYDEDGPRTIVWAEYAIRTTSNTPSSPTSSHIRE